MVKYLIIIFLLIEIISNLKAQKKGTCFRSKSNEGLCFNYLGIATRKQCCRMNGYFVSRADQGRLLLSVLIDSHGVPLCEKSCDFDFCKNRNCPINEFCIPRSNSSICSSDCKCTEKQRNSKPVCLRNGRKYRNMCELHLESCWSNTHPKIVPCVKLGCQSIQCPDSMKCYLNKEGRSVCGTLKDCQNQDFNPVCSTNNQTFSNICQLENTGKIQGKENEIAYKGSCRDDANSENVECPHDNQQIIDHYKSNGGPVCISCPQFCPQTQYSPAKTLCLSNKRQISSICMKNLLSCHLNQYIEIIHSGPCLLTAQRPNY